ncbi:hypothetical protein CEUSTIGMA_g9241.t1 [Chlamydomonas eustigma]|uniref:Uncharacterized protein n=1 Tax=Chlamydomonas eustigma TaxID=1157962 RepID=A0A250XFI2_9CHLO|nr:hypothetical protein CEUSTIGMA_g9241.t1 [Chlamydomonas eustigma]|eukprot:GAX81813.1 hypothetical protein CEUSTIGMA_g9241.t1 [Chlamydomonas eustigma]
MEVSSAKSVMKKSINQGLGRLTSGVDGAKFWASEPYYQPDTRYVGIPRYMNEKEYPWWPMVNCSDLISADTDLAGGASTAIYSPEAVEKMKSDKKVKMSAWYLDSAEGPWNVNQRLKSYKDLKVKESSGADLRERNIKWYLKSMSPSEFPLKNDQWKAVIKKAKKAAEEARKRAPCPPGGKIEIRKKKTLCKLSFSLNTPDGFCHTPLQYAMLMLLKDRHSSVVKHIVDVLLSHLPFINRAFVAQQYISITVKEARRILENRIDAALERTGSTPKALMKELSSLDDQVLLYGQGFTAQDDPSVMDPLILGALLNDMGRIAWMVIKCGGNLNDAYVAMPDIPKYLQGQWERMCCRCESRVLPIHIGVMQKRFETVRLLLDLGAEPNAFGTEFTGNTQKDQKRRLKLLANKKSVVLEFKKEASTSNPFESVWKTKSRGVIKMLKGLKRFVMSIEIPGISKPYPWVSALHLSCRFGQPAITFLLLKRGAALNGGGAAAFAPKSPLEEALSYARSNCQAYNTLAERAAYAEVRKEACLDESASIGIEYQERKLQEYLGILKGKAVKIADKEWAKAKQKDSSAARPDADEVLKTALGALSFQPNTLSCFSSEDLAKIAIPEMSPVARMAAAYNAVADAFDYLDPTKATMKAVAFAAKIIVKILLEMMKRPICHWDPALYTAHVMLYHRAPLNITEKQTAILLRDLVDNSTYEWLALDKNIVAEHVWQKSAVNGINALKSNNDVGYKCLDMTSNPKTYKKARRELENKVESTVFSTAMSAVLPAYFLPTLTTQLSMGDDGKLAPISSKQVLHQRVTDLVKASLLNEMQISMEKAVRTLFKEAEDMKMSSAAPASRGATDPLSSAFPDLEADELQKLGSWGSQQVQDIQKRMVALSTNNKKGSAMEAVMEVWKGKKDHNASDYPPIFKALMSKSAKTMLPEWYMDLAKDELTSVDAVIKCISDSFCNFDPAKQAPKEVQGMPQVNDEGISMNPLELMANNGSEDSLAYKEPSFPEKSLAKKKKTVADLPIADCVKAVQSAFVFVQAKRLKVDQELRSSLFGGIVDAVTKQRAGLTTALMEERKRLLTNTLNEMMVDQGLSLRAESVVNAAMNRVTLELAAFKLGPNGAAVMEVLKSGLCGVGGLGDLDPSLAGLVLDVVKDVGNLSGKVANGSLMGDTGALILGKLNDSIPGMELDIVSSPIAQLLNAAASDGMAGVLSKLRSYPSAAKVIGESFKAGPSAESLIKVATDPIMSMAVPQADAIQSFMTKLLDGSAMNPDQFKELLEGDAVAEIQGALQEGSDPFFNALSKRGVNISPELKASLTEDILSGNLSGLTSDVQQSILSNVTAVATQGAGAGWVSTAEAEIVRTVDSALSLNAGTEAVLQGLASLGFKNVEDLMKEDEIQNALKDGSDALFKKLRKKGINISPEQEQALKDDVESGDFGAVGADLEEVAESDAFAEIDKLAAICGSAISKKFMDSAAGKSVMGVSKMMAENPLTKQATENLEEYARQQLAGLEKDPMGQIGTMLNLPDNMSLDNIEASFDGINATFENALDGADFDTLEQMVLGLQLDLALDFEGVVEALAEARDALVYILEMIGMD